MYLYVNDEINVILLIYACWVQICNQIYEIWRLRQNANFKSMTDWILKLMEPSEWLYSNIMCHVLKVTLSSLSLSKTASTFFQIYISILSLVLKTPLISLCSLECSRERSQKLNEIFSQSCRKYVCRISITIFQRVHVFTTSYLIKLHAPVTITLFSVLISSST